MLFDPLEKEFHLPTASIELRDGEGGKGKIVGQEDQISVVFGIVESNPAQLVWITLFGNRRPAKK
jgi:hypothetical protein